MNLYHWKLYVPIRKGESAMANKTRLIIKTLIDELKRNKDILGDFVCAETYGTHFSAVNIAANGKDEPECYKVIVIKEDIGRKKTQENFMETSKKIKKPAVRSLET